MRASAARLKELRTAPSRSRGGDEDGSLAADRGLSAQPLKRGDDPESQIIIFENSGALGLSAIRFRCATSSASSFIHDHCLQPIASV